MRKSLKIISAVLLLVFLMSGAAMAAPRHRDRRHNPPPRQERRVSHPSHHGRQYDPPPRYEFRDHRYHGEYWRRPVHHYAHRKPWYWHSRRYHGTTIIVDVDWNQCFPGLRSYRWHGRGFFYRGIEYVDAVLFYDNYDALVSVGFWRNGRFVMIRDDDSVHYSDNRTLIEYFDRHFGIRLRL